MIRHIVAWRLASPDAAQRRAAADEIQVRFDALPAKIPSLGALEIGIDLAETEGNWHVILVSEFATRADLDAYQVHPAHVEAAAFVGTVRSDRMCVDYEV